MDDSLDKITIAIPCGACGKKVKKTIAWIKSHTDFRCVCGVTTLLDTRQLTREIGKVEAATKELRATLSKLKKK